jgi:hypothetical protein
MSALSDANGQAVRKALLGNMTASGTSNFI